jgi:hypothetical protein
VAGRLRRIRQAMLDCVAYEFGLIGHVHFFEDACLVRADGLGAEVELGGNTC